LIPIIGREAGISHSLLSVNATPMKGVTGKLAFANNSRAAFRVTVIGADPWDNAALSLADSGIRATAIAATGHALLHTP
jgi:hypothetical protein